VLRLRKHEPVELDLAADEEDEAEGVEDGDAEIEGVGAAFCGTSVDVGAVDGVAVADPPLTDTASPATSLVSANTSL